MSVSRRLTGAVPSCALALAMACGKTVPDEHVRPLGALTGAPAGSAGATPWGGATGGSSSGGAAGDGAAMGGATNTESGAGGTGALSNAGAAGSGAAPNGSAEAGFSFELAEKAFTKPNLLEALGECARASYGEFEQHARALDTAVAELAAAPDEAKAESARLAWRTAMASWQRAEPLSFGPAARSSAPGGRDLRDNIYVFPLANYCQVDQRITASAYAGADFATSLVSTRGLSALEYLLFNTSSGNACLPALAINSAGTWAALGDQIWQRRADYAARAASDVAERARSLSEAWRPEGGNFLAELTTAGQSSATFSSAQQAFNAVSDALFYVEKEVKDWKLGWPLGLVPDCINAPGLCPSEIESRYAFASTDHLRQNLIGFRRVFQGCGPAYSGLGFDDWLSEAGAADLALSMVQATEAAQAAVESLAPPLEQALFVDPSRVRALHGSVKAITDPLKTEFLTVLNLDLPKVSEGDND
jgi:uncharacterized protein